MGTWGSGNFDSDHALDYLADVCGPLVGKLTDVVENPELAEADEDGWEEALVAAEILAAVGEHYSSEQLTPQLVTDCRDTILTQWDATIDGLDPDPDYKTERRAVIAATFARLLAVVQS